MAKLKINHTEGIKIFEQCFTKVFIYISVLFLSLVVYTSTTGTPIRRGPTLHGDFSCNCCHVHVTRLKCSRSYPALFPDKQCLQFSHYYFGWDLLGWEFFGTLIEALICSSFWYERAHFSKLSLKIRSRDFELEMVLFCYAGCTLVTLTSPSCKVIISFLNSSFLFYADRKSCRRLTSYSCLVPWAIRVQSDVDLWE